MIWRPIIGWLGIALLHAAESPENTIEKVKQVEQSAGIKSTGNFQRSDPGVRAYYRCYFTRPLELPDSYTGLKLREGTPEGCPVEAEKYDVFFYPIEAVASGHAPLTESLAKSPAERLVTVVPHEDFHGQVANLPEAIAEPAATLVGFLTGAAAMASAPDSGLYREARLFLEKSELVNRYFDQVSEVLKAAHEGSLTEKSALHRKQTLLAELQQECARIQPEPRSFNKCLPVANNAGLAFDHTYTKYYPVLYEAMAGCRYSLECTVQAITHIPKHAGEAAVIRYFEAFLRLRSP